VAIAAALIEHGTLDAKQIDAIIIAAESPTPVHDPVLRAEKLRRKEWAAMVANVERSGLQMTLRV
jgi:hypothetical protein